MDNFVKIISAIIIILLILGLFSFVMIYTNGLTTDFKSFYVVYNNEKILDYSNNLVLPKNKPIRFEIEYLFGTFNKQHNTEYGVKIIPNVSSGNDFNFKVDGEVRSFGAEKDLTAGFDIELNEGYFTIIIGNRSIREILCLIYPDKEITEAYNDFNPDPFFTLVVTSYNGKSEIKIELRLAFKVEAENITLDKSEVIINE